MTARSPAPEAASLGSLTVSAFCHRPGPSLLTRTGFIGGPHVVTEKLRWTETGLPNEKRFNLTCVPMQLLGERRGGRGKGEGRRERLLTLASLKPFQTSQGQGNTPLRMCSVFCALL